jgi:hypothetical protein
MARVMSVRAFIGAGLMLGLTAPPALAQINTALSQAEANTIIYEKCGSERDRAQAAVGMMNPPWKWNDVLRKANQVLLANVEDGQLQRMLDEADRTSGSRAEQDMAQFQYCLIMNKFAYSDMHEKRAKR